MSERLSQRRDNKNKTLTGASLNFETAERNVESEVPAFNRGGVWDREGKGTGAEPEG